MHKNTKKIDIYKLFAIFSLKNIIIGFLAVASWSFFWGLVGGSLGADVAPLRLDRLPPEMGSGVGVRRGAADHSRAVDKGLSYRAPQMRKSFISSWYQSDRVRSLLRMQQISSLDCSTMPFFSTRTCRLAPFSGTVLMA